MNKSLSIKFGDNLFYEKHKLYRVSVLITILLYLIIIGITFINPIHKNALSILGWGTIGMIICYFLSSKKLELSVQISNLIIILTVSLSVYYSNYKIPLAPFGALFVSIINILFVKNKLLRILIITPSLIAFNFTYYHQIHLTKFSYFDFIPVVASSILIIFLIYIFIELMYHYQNTIEENNTKLKELNKKLKKQNEEIISLKNSEIALERENYNLLNTSIKIQEELKSDVISRLKNILKTPKNTGSEIRKVIIDLNDQAIKDQKLNLLSKSNIDFSEIQFRKQLKSNFNNLTPKELDLAVYIRLGIENKEITTLLNISENALYVKKSRLKKKLNTTDVYHTLINL